jgi:superfamily II DNA/RNA helicase
MLINKRSAGSTGLKPEERTKMQEAFKHDPDVQVLIATDAAGEGINLQRANLMVVKFQQRYQNSHRPCDFWHRWVWQGTEQRHLGGGLK